MGNQPGRRNLLISIFGWIFSRENLLALILAILLILVIVFTIDTSSTWIYQGF
jgi:hypothetical protein